MYYKYVYICIYVCVHTSYIYIYIHVCVYIYIYVCVCLLISFHTLSLRMFEEFQFSLAHIPHGPKFIKANLQLVTLITKDPGDMINEKDKE